ncbi:MAG TPA: putative peptidoglycan glycosyltransferase FtsW [Solirubrobacteraceae bacterium]|nr:putative peptidoglycan glycosyltransferase FtsW [Solirubrobacteraceae bacterium]
MAVRAAGARGRTDAPERTRSSRRPPPPLEHRILTTATLCLLAFGAVMVYSASSPSGVISSGGHGLGTGEFVMYLVAAALGLVAMRVAERHGLALLTTGFVNGLLLVSFVLLLAVLVVGVDIGGARRWIGAGGFQFQPSEVMKLALVLYAARYLAEHPKRLHRGFRQAVMPIGIVVAPACALIAVEPDLGTTLVVALTIGSLLITAGMPTRHLVAVAGVAGLALVLLVVAQPYEMVRLTSFLHPSQCAQTTCYQAAQGQIAVGSGGIFGVGLGKSVQKVLYLPEAQTDFILAVIGEELGVMGILGVALLYGMIAYAGLRTARKAATRYAKLLATGLTSLILCQGILNIFVVLGIAPLTGVPLPFISYAPSSLCVLLASVGLLLNISRPAARSLRAVDGGEGSSRKGRSAGERATERDRRGRDRRGRGAGSGGRRRAAG